MADFDPLRTIGFYDEFAAMDAAEQMLPASLMAKANFRSGEFAWYPADIPEVIEAGRRANLVNLGGDLQVRAPSGFWGEAVGVSVRPCVPHDLPWSERVEATAIAALADFEAMQGECDFEAIAREAFPSLMAEVADPKTAIFFGWLFLSHDEEIRIEAGPG